MDYKSQSSLCKTHDLLDVLLRGVEGGKWESLTKRKSDELWILKEKNVEKKTLELEALGTVVKDATNRSSSVIRFKLRKRYSSHSLGSTYRSMALDESLI